MDTARGAAPLSKPAAKSKAAQIRARKQEWYVLMSWNRLHAAREIDNKGEYEPGGYGVTECGRAGLLAVPGFISRLGLPRCAHCCKAVGIERGVGTPYNGR